MNRPVTQMKMSALTQAFNVHWETCGRTPFWHTLKENILAAASETKAARKRATRKDTPVTKQRFLNQINAAFHEKLHYHAREVFGKLSNRILPKKEVDKWSGIEFASEALVQEAEFHDLRIKAGDDISKLPIQDCDYLLDSINCLADTLRAKGIGPGQNATAGGESVNMPVSATRFRIRSSDDLPDMKHLVLTHDCPGCSCCNRKHRA
ncbi:hypothetical protein KVR01_009360 [Diaporthe batatas]|uniref:uncharacterized protein n=1 Tax=Diaporthe batatas TaxID=748121 RepID=UPI001D042626|nr:uncharacterized protein KVR01_009360 [Diaporthe batatas]KAG8161096.1 hypothetical protein KVR01_009360 [Diaporthe batatas]